MSYQRILIAVDLTGEAPEVINAAKEQASQSADAKIHLVNVIRPVAYNYAALDPAALAIPANLDRQLEEHARGMLTTWAEANALDTENVHIRMGAPAHEIKQAAEELDADLIVIGTHGQHGLGLLLGSTANGVLHGVKCDVLTVRIH